MAIRNEVKERISVIQSLFAPYSGKPLTITFGKHVFKGVMLREITNQPVTGFKRAPDKRSNGDKQYSPVLIKLIFDDPDDPEGNSMVFVDEDTEWSAISNGVRARLQVDVVTFRVEG